MSAQDRNSETGTFVSRGSARSSRSSTAWSLASRGRALRVYVQLSNGEKLLVPLPEHAKVHDLHAAALRRAASVGFIATLGDTVVRTSGSNPATLFAEDSLQDFLDLTENNTFSLEYQDKVSGLIPHGLWCSDFVSRSSYRWSNPHPSQHHLYPRPLSPQQLSPRPRSGPSTACLAQNMCLFVGLPLLTQRPRLIWEQFRATLCRSFEVRRLMSCIMKQFLVFAATGSHLDALTPPG
jgi:hypothetical protein